MNPLQDDQNNKPVSNALPGTSPKVDPATFVPEDSSPEADQAALEAIGVLEAEESTSQTLEQAHTTPTLTDIPEPTPVPPATPTPPSAPVAVEVPKEVLQEERLSSSDTPFKAFPSNENSSGFPGALNQAPVLTNTDPFAVQKQKKSSKKLIIILIAAIVLIGGAVAGYFVWQSMQSEPTVTPQTTTGDQPGGTVETPTDTQDSVNTRATVIETDANSTDDTVYDDSSLSDATLYGN